MTDHAPDSALAAAPSPVPTGGPPIVSEPINIQAGVRSPLPTDLYDSIPAHIADPLLALGRACN
jgi:hypothetical protein